MRNLMVVCSCLPHHTPRASLWLSDKAKGYRWDEMEGFGDVEPATVRSSQSRHGDGDMAVSLEPTNVFAALDVPEAYIYCLPHCCLCHCSAPGKTHLQQSDWSGFASIVLHYVHRPQSLKTTKSS